MRVFFFFTSKTPFDASRVCSRFLLSIWPDRTKRIGLLLASWTPLVLWLLFLDWVETLEIRPCEMTELRSFDPLDLNLLRFLLLAYHIFFFFIQLLYLWKQGWWPFNGVTSGTRDSVPHGRGGQGVVWCLSKMFLFSLGRLPKIWSVSYVALLQMNSILLPAPLLSSNRTSPHP